MMSARFHSLLHPLLLSLMKCQHKHQLHIMNSRPDIDGNAIYAINHSCKFDMIYASELIEVHSYVLAGKQRMRLMDRLIFFLNGVIYVDRKNKVSKALAKERMKKILTEGQNLCMFPEGTWNLTPSKPMLPLYWGIIDIARETKRPIIPLVLEFREKVCYVKWGGVYTLRQGRTNRTK